MQCGRDNWILIGKDRAQIQQDLTIFDAGNDRGIRRAEANCEFIRAESGATDGQQAGGKNRGGSGAATYD